MEIREFKQTEIGRIPKEWEVTRLGDVSKQRNEIVQPGQERNDKFVGLEHLEKGESRIKGYGLASGVISSKFRFFARDILYGKLRPYLDKAVIADFTGICSTDLLVIDQDKKKVQPNFLMYIIHSPNFISHAISTTSGTNHPRTSWNAIAKFKFPLPPLLEQKKIAEVLTTVDQAIEKVDEAIEKTQRLKKGLMQELLTKGIGHKEFKDTEIGRIPKEWDVVKILELGKIVTGGTPSTSNNTYWNGTIPFITPADIKGDKYIYQTERNITSEGARKIGIILPTNTVLVVCIGSTIGKTGVTYRESVTNQQINAIICNGEVNGDYVYYAITFRSDSLKAFSGVAAVPIIKKSLFEQFKIPLAPLSERQKIAEILSAVDERLELLRTRKERLEKIKKGLMNDLLTGRKRVRLV